MEKLCGQAPLKPPCFSIPTPPPPICVQVANRAEFLGSGLLQHDCKVGTEQFIGVFAQNRPEVRVHPSAFRGISRLGNGNPVSTLGRAWGLTNNRDLGPWHYHLHPQLSPAIGMDALPRPHPHCTWSHRGGKVMIKRPGQGQAVDLGCLDMKSRGYTLA